MVLACLCALALQQKSFFQQIGITPTGNNGYEEFIEAADIAQSPEFAAYNARLQFLKRGFTTDKPLPRDVLPSDDILTVRKKWRSHFPKVQTLIQEGLTKKFLPLQVPESRIWFNPELGALKTTCRFFASNAIVSLSEGDLNGAFQDFELVFQIADHVPLTSIVRGLISFSFRSMVISTLQDYWQQMDLKSCQELIKIFAHFPKGMDLLVKGAQFEQSIAQTLVKVCVAETLRPDEPATSDPDPDETEQTKRDFLKLNSEARIAVITAASRIVQQEYETILTQYEQGEANTLRYLNALPTAPDDPPLSTSSTEPLQDRLAALIDPEPDVALFILGIQTRSRLCFLTAKACEYRWLHEKLPDKLEDFTTKAERTDPTSDKPFKYKKTDSWFEITRENDDALGKLGLVPTPKQSPTSVEESRPGAP